ncbi:4Fe-4S binding protein [Candidatus Bipolaricaulota bacterium]|nr:4Fe-4S binding protein [Candidatus Bipolaricaulota bacterium]MBS3792099.1 4Fe-4S binding protein [Candidatus Bipolaricaulota bacterium]
MPATKSKSPVFIQAELCKGCGLCVYYCPKDVLEMSKDMNEKGYNLAKVARPDDCIKCQQCEINCPDLAITVDS